jgi:hypothetical protein
MMGAHRGGPFGARWSVGGMKIYCESYGDLGARLGAVLSETHDVLNGLLGDARLIAAHCALFDDMAFCLSNNDVNEATRRPARPATHATRDDNPGTTERRRRLTHRRSQLRIRTCASWLLPLHLGRPQPGRSGMRF